MGDLNSHIQTCEHLEWLATGLSIPEPGQITWDSMMCRDCGIVRSENRLEPGESVSFSLDEVEELRNR